MVPSHRGAVHSQQRHLGPNEVSIIDPNLINAIMGPSGLPKGPCALESQQLGRIRLSDSCERRLCGRINV